MELHRLFLEIERLYEEVGAPLNLAIQDFNQG